MTLKNTTIILPTLNEEECLPLLLDALIKNYPETKIIIVDDGSKDKTKKISLKYVKKNQNIVFFDRSKEKIHGICISAIRGIQKSKTKYFILMDADLQHPPEKVKEMVKELCKDYKLVIAVRKKVQNWKFNRRLMSIIATFLARICLFLRRKKISKDPNSGFFFF